MCAALEAQTGSIGRTARAADRDSSKLDKFELGLNVADIRTDCIGTKYCGLPSFALGAGGSLNLNSHFAIDLNVLVTPTESLVATNVYGGRHEEYLLGLRAEARAKHYGYFLRAQPGLSSWNHVIRGTVTPPQGQWYFRFGDRREFVSNVAAGFEYSPSPRIHFRGEIGDLVRAYSSSSWSNNLESLAGVYVGLGKPMPWRAPVYVRKSAHPFFDSLNLALITSSALAMTADSITTQRFISQGAVEGDPFARPLVKYGWSGQVAAEGLEINAVIWGMYGLHRIHQHWIERIAPAGVALAHGFFAYQNDGASAHPSPAP